MSRRRIAVGVAAALALGGGGAAVAAQQLTSPKEESAAIVKDAANQLGVEPEALSSALKKAIENRIDAAVADGRLTKEQGDALKQRVESGEFPLFAGPGFGGHRTFHMFHDLDAAATYLGLSEEELRSQLESGKTLADVAKAQGKSVDGLVDALVAEFKTHVDAAVAAGRLTQAQADEVLADVRQRIADRVNGKAPEFERHAPAFAGPPVGGAFA